MRLVPPLDPIDPIDPPEVVEVEASDVRSREMSPLHLIPSFVLMMNAAHLQYVAAHVYSQAQGGK